MRLRLAVVGSGVAGVASALLLARAGHAVDVFEAVDDPQPIGAGLLLQPTGQEVLRRLGLLDAMCALGATVHRLYGDTAGGRPVLDMAYADHAPGAFGLGVRRGALMGLLWQALRDSEREHGSRWRLGCAVDAWSHRHDQVVLGSGGRELGAYDGLLLASGTFSTLREAMAVPQRVRPYPWGAVWVVLPQSEAWPVTELRQRYRSARQMLGLMPVGFAHGLPLEGQQPGVNLFWSLSTAELPTWPAQGLAAWKREATDLLPACAPLLESLTDAGALRPARYADVVMARWHDGRVVAVGDCAHGMSPQLGQGANLALVDAWTLARCVAQSQAERRSPGAAWCAALEGYSRARRSHLRFYHRASRALTPLFQSHQRVAPWCRDVFFGWGGRLPFVRKHSMAALAGAKTGWVWGRLQW